MNRLLFVICSKQCGGPGQENTVFKEVVGGRKTEEIFGKVIKQGSRYSIFYFGFPDLSNIVIIQPISPKLR